MTTATGSFISQEQRVEILPVAPYMVDEYYKWFVNRRAYLVQRKKPAANGKFSYYSPCKMVNGERTDEKLQLTRKDVEMHLAGRKTISLYSIEPKQSTCKWIAIDADYDTGRVEKDLSRLQYDLSLVGIQAIREHSRRGGHLWILAADPLPAVLCRTFVYNLATRLDVPIKGHMHELEGIEIFPRQNRLEEGYFGNAVRGPLGIHRATCKRYWFEGADATLEKQFNFLRRVKRLTLEELETLTYGMDPIEDNSPDPVTVPFQPHYSNTNGNGRGFNILEHVRIRRTDRRNHWAQCPACARAGNDRGRDNLAIKVSEPTKYKCWAGHTKNDIRAACGYGPAVSRQY